MIEYIYKNDKYYIWCISSVAECTVYYHYQLWLTARLDIIYPETWESTKPSGHPNTVSVWTPTDRKSSKQNLKPQMWTRKKGLGAKLPSGWTVSRRSRVFKCRACISLHLFPSACTHVFSLSSSLSLSKHIDIRPWIYYTGSRIVFLVLLYSIWFKSGISGIGHRPPPLFSLRFLLFFFLLCFLVSDLIQGFQYMLSAIGHMGFVFV